MSMTPLSDLAYARLLTLIDDGRFAAGARLPGEIALAARFGVSRPVLRQALARLRAEGRIQARKGAGNFVGSPGVDVPALRFEALHNVPDMRAFLEFRCMLESEAAARAAACADPTRFRQIRVRFRRFESAVRYREPAIDEDVAFHDAIARASDNRFLIATLAALREQCRLGIQFIRQLGGEASAARIQTVLAEHRAIDEAIAARDADGARRAMLAHLQGGIARLFGLAGGPAAGAPDTGKPVAGPPFGRPAGISAATGPRRR